jgi:hypothetical protein
VRCSSCDATPSTGSRFCPSCGRLLQTSSPGVDVSLAGDDHTRAQRTPSLSPHEITWSPAAARPAVGGSIEPGAVLAGRYRIIRQLGRGGMGIVYHADDLRLGHAVALKFLPSALAADEHRLNAFHREVSVARQITHPNVCRVYDIGDADGHLFLSMEYIEGEDLATAIARRGAMPESEGIELAREICAGLAAVHARGVLHRDLKPANIMLDPQGRARLTDFGISSLGDQAATERATEGTPAYMAPEQLEERRVSVASDIYSLGLVLYEVFTGRRPFEANTFEELTRRQTALTSAPPPDLSPLTPKLRETILNCLARDPARRPPSSAAVLGMLQVRLLDAEARGRRRLQVFTQMGAPALSMAGIGLLFSSGAGVLAGVLMLAAAMILVAIEIRWPLGWTVQYKGHQIRFYNHPIFGERLFIDGRLADRGRFGFDVTLRGTIESGAGAGERVTAQVSGNFARMAVSIVAESFVPDATART